MNIEPLELRIAPAAVFTYADVDGDFVTIKTSRGTDAQLAAILTLAATGLGMELQEIDFSVNAAVFAGTTLTVSAVRTSAGGDGRVNVGYIDAASSIDGAGLDLGAVVINGDLGQIDAGTLGTPASAIKGLTVLSLGQFGLTTQGAAGSLNSTVIGRLDFLKVAGDIRGAFIDVIGAGGSIGAVTIGGSLLGGAADNSGGISSSGAIGAVKIGGDLEGGGGEFSGTIVANGAIASATIGGSLLGGDGDISANLVSLAGTLGAVKIGGNIEGGSGESSGRILANVGIVSLTVGGSLLGGVADDGGSVFAEASLGAVKISGNVEGGGGFQSGSIDSNGTIGSITIGGSLLGGADQFAGAIHSNGSMGAVKIAGNVEGGSGAYSARIVAFNASLASVTIGGSLLGGTTTGAGRIQSGGTLGAVKILGNLVGGSTDGADSTFAGSIGAGRIVSLFVGGSIVSGTASGGDTLTDSGAVRAENDIGAIVVKGGLIGNATESVLITARGQAIPSGTSDLAIKSLTVGGRVERAQILAGYDDSLTPTGVNADAQIGAVVVGDWIASNLVAGAVPDNAFFGDLDDDPIAEVGQAPGIDSRIASIVIKNTALGSAAGGDHFGFVAQRIGSLKIGTTALPLSPGASDDLAGLAIGITGDLRVVEI